MFVLHAEAKDVPGSSSSRIVHLGIFFLSCVCLWCCIYGVMCECGNIHVVVQVHASMHTYVEAKSRIKCLSISLSILLPQDGLSH